MFKRRGRILFLDAGAGTRAAMARAWASELGGLWVEAEAGTLGKGVPDAGMPVVMAEREVVAHTGCLPWERAREMAWDLVIPLDLGTGEDWPGILAGFRCKRWDLTGTCPAGDADLPLAALRVCRDEVRNRVAGLLGGFRMKAREDEGAGPPPNDGSGAG